MAQEIELKLALPRRDHDRFRESPLLTEYATGAPTRRPLYNDYYDTPDQALNRQGVALRIRRQGARYLQTLKTRGDSRGGLHQRHEWEWALDAPTLNPALIPAGALPEGLGLEGLAPAFTTHFERSCWQLHYPHPDGSAEIELVLDDGVARAGDRSDPISEIELELKAGPAAALFAFALRLAEAFPLRISRISKGERGYRLQHPERARQLPEPPAAAAAPRARALALLERAQGAMEAYEFLGEAPLLEEIRQALEALLPLSASQPHWDLDEAAETLAALTAELASIRALPEGPAQAQRARAWLEQQPLGLALLRLSQVLYLDA